MITRRSFQTAGGPSDVRPNAGRAGHWWRRIQSISARALPSGEVAGRVGDLAHLFEQLRLAVAGPAGIRARRGGEQHRLLSLLVALGGSVLVVGPTRGDEWPHRVRLDGRVVFRVALMRCPVMDVERPRERLDRGQQSLLESDEQQTIDRPDTGWRVGQALRAQRPILIQHLGEHELRCVVGQPVDPHRCHDATGKAALHRADVLLQPADHHLAQAARRPDLDPAREPVGIEQLEQCREAVGSGRCAGSQTETGDVRTARLGHGTALVSFVSTA